MVGITLRTRTFRCRSKGCASTIARVTTGRHPPRSENVRVNTPRYRCDGDFPRIVTNSARDLSKRVSCARRCSCWCLAGLAVVVTLVASGCGASTSPAPSISVTSQASNALPRCSVDTARAKRGLPGIRADIARISRARTHAQTSAATDRFINDFNRSTLSLVTKSRLVDRAVSAVAGKCNDCFQALEPMHTKPSLGLHVCR
jgi:hypothetical protein